jgi:hypothetical protein
MIDRTHCTAIHHHAALAVARVAMLRFCRNACAIVAPSRCRRSSSSALESKMAPGMRRPEPSSCRGHRVWVGSAREGCALFVNGSFMADVNANSETCSRGSKGRGFLDGSIPSRFPDRNWTTGNAGENANLADFRASDPLSINRGWRRSDAQLAPLRSCCCSSRRLCSGCSSSRSRMYGRG